MHARFSVPFQTTLCAAALMLVWLAAPPASAAIGVDPSRFQALHWRGIGPYRGGRVLAVTGVPGEPNVYYFGAVAGGVWKTTRRRRILDRRSRITRRSPPSARIAVAPSDHNILYVGTGEASPRGDMTYGNGVFKSLDGGKTLAEPRACRYPPDRRPHRRSQESRHRARRGARPCLRAQCGARRLSHRRWRQDLDQGALEGRPHRRHRRDVRSARFEDRLRSAVAGAAPAVEFLERRPGQRSLPFDATAE